MRQSVPPTVAAEVEMAGEETDCEMPKWSRSRVRSPCAVACAYLISGDLGSSRVISREGGGVAVCAHRPTFETPAE